MSHSRLSVKCLYDIKNVFIASVGIRDVPLGSGDQKLDTMPLLVAQWKMGLGHFIYSYNDPALYRSIFLFQINPLLDVCRSRPDQQVSLLGRVNANTDMLGEQRWAFWFFVRRTALWCCDRRRPSETLRYLQPLRPEGTTVLIKLKRDVHACWCQVWRG